MSNALERGIRATFGGAPPRIRNDTPIAARHISPGYSDGATPTPTASSAMKLSTVNRCIEILSDSMGKLPMYIMDRQTRERVEMPVRDLLTIRPNEAQTPFAMKKMCQANVECGGNGYILIVRDERTLAPSELIPVPHELVIPWLDKSGRLWYQVVHPYTGEPMTVPRMDMIHITGYSHNGITGISTLSRAAEVIASSRAAQQYNLNYYRNGGQPSGVLETEADLGGSVEIRLADGTVETISRKDLIRNEWEKRHAGVDAANRIAILDYGLKYTPISVSNRDAQFVEQMAQSVEDVARFFGVPLYKLQAGKQSYSSNEQNAIEYVVGTLQSRVTTTEEELTYKLLPGDVAKKYRIRANMMVELRGDFASRGAWYKTMREIGAFSVDDVREREDLPDVPGGDTRQASLNYVPLETWADEALRRINGGDGN